MTKDEFFAEMEKDFDNLDLPNAIRLVKVYNNIARKYYELWQKAEQEIIQL
jgi:hypothetical protein